MVALMKFTRDICRLLGLGNGKKWTSFQELLNSATSSNGAGNGSDNMSQRQTGDKIFTLKSVFAVVFRVFCLCLPTQSEFLLKQ